jgi:hypothetical protein
MSTRKTPGGKGGRCVRVTTLPPSLCRKSRKSGALIYRNPKGRLRPVEGELYLFSRTFAWRSVEKHRDNPLPYLIQKLNVTEFCQGHEMPNCNTPNPYSFLLREQIFTNRPDAKTAVLCSYSIIDVSETLSPSSALKTDVAGPPKSPQIFHRLLGVCC